MPDQAKIDAFMSELLGDLEGEALSSPSFSGSFKSPLAKPSFSTKSASKRRRLSLTTSTSTNSNTLCGARSLRSPASAASTSAEQLHPQFPPTLPPFWPMIDAQGLTSPLAGLKRRGTLVHDENARESRQATPTKERRSSGFKASTSLRPNEAGLKGDGSGTSIKKSPRKHVAVEIESTSREARPALGQRPVNVPATAAAATIAGSTVPEVRLEPLPQSDTDYFDDDLVLDDHELEQVFQIEAAKAVEAVSNVLPLLVRARVRTDGADQPESRSTTPPTVRGTLDVPSKVSRTSLMAAR